MIHMARGDGGWEQSAGRCAHGVPKGERCEQCVSEQGSIALHKAGNRMVFGDPEPTLEQMLDEVSELRAALERTGKENESGAPDYLEGTSYHQRANELRARLDAFVISEVSGRPATDMSREEWSKLYSAWPEKESFEAAEQSATEAYRRASRSGWRFEGLGRSGQASLGPEHAAFQLLDLEWAAAERETDDQRRNALLDRLEKDYAARIALLEDRNIRAEYFVMLIMRRQLRERGLDHAVSIEHALPRQDLRDDYKQDLELRVSPYSNPLQLKNLDLSDSLKTEFNEGVIRREQDAIKAKNSSTTMVVVDSVYLRDAIGAYQEGMLGNQRKLLAALVEQLPEGPKLALAKLIEVEKPKARVKANDADLQKFLNPQQLVSLGYLAAERAKDPQAILAAKKEAVAKVKVLKPKLDELSEPSFLKKIKKAA